MIEFIFITTWAILCLSIGKLSVPVVMDVIRCIDDGLSTKRDLVILLILITGCIVCITIMFLFMLGWVR